jgi:hypothetical protein
LKSIHSVVYRDNDDDDDDDLMGDATNGFDGLYSYEHSLDDDDDDDDVCSGEESGGGGGC